MLQRIVTGLSVAGAMALLSTASTTSGYGLLVAVLVILGFGMGNVMAPATDSIMGRCPWQRQASARRSTTRRGRSVGR